VPQEWEKWQRAASPARLPALPSARACVFCRALNRFVRVSAVLRENPGLRCKSTSRTLQQPIKGQQARTKTQTPLYLASLAPLLSETRAASVRVVGLPSTRD